MENGNRSELEAAGPVVEELPVAGVSGVDDDEVGTSFEEEGSADGLSLVDEDVALPLEEEAPLSFGPLFFLEMDFDVDSGVAAMIQVCKKLGRYGVKIYSQVTSPIEKKNHQSAKPGFRDTFQRDEGQ